MSFPSGDSHPRSNTPKHSPSREPQLDQEALFEELADTLQRIAWAILRDWQLASDAVQETFLLLGEKWSEVEAERRKGWLVRTVQFQAKNIRRKQGRHRVPEQELENVAAPYGDGSDHLAQTDEIERIAQRISKLPPAQRAVMEKRFREDKTFAEIAEELNIPLGTVLSRMRLGLQKLRQASLD